MWHAVIDLAVVGPLNDEQIAAELYQGRIQPDSLVRSGQSPWRPARTWQELEILLRHYRPRKTKKAEPPTRTMASAPRPSLPKAAVAPLPITPQVIYMSQPQPQPSDPPRDQPHEMLARCFAAALLIGLMIFALKSCSHTSHNVGGRTGAAEYNGSESSAKAFGRRWAMEVAEDYLRSPSQADWGFWDMTATKLAPIEGRPAWRTSGTLDAPNAYGAMVRMRWAAIVSYDAAKRDYIAEEVTFDDEVAYRRR